MTNYEYDNLPDGDEMGMLRALPQELFEDGKAAIIAALESEEAEAQEIKAAYAFNRKGYLFIEPLGTLERNASYSSDNDHIILQLTLRMPNPKNRSGLDAIADLEGKANEHYREAARAALTAQIAADEAAAEKASADAAKRRAQLEKLNSL